MPRKDLPSTVARRTGGTLWLAASAVGAVTALVASLALSTTMNTADSQPLAHQTPAPTTTSLAATTTNSTSTTPTSTTSPSRATTAVTRPATGTTLGGCPNLPADNIWHATVTSLPVQPNSSQYVASIGASAKVHADFGAGDWDGGPIGIPITYVSGSQPKVPVTFDYAGESDPGPYPIPADAAVESGGDRHVLVVDRDNCRLYELYDAERRPDGSWHAGSGAVFDLRGDQLRPAGRTSADAAGLPILPGLVRYDEVAAGRVDHAIRVTVPRTQQEHLWPARHDAGASNAALPPMGLRLRLKANVDVSGLPTQARVIAQAMKTEGVIVADNGSPWYISGIPEPRWDNDALQALAALHGTDFEAVDASGLMVSPDSGRTR